MFRFQIAAALVLAVSGLGGVAHAEQRSFSPPWLESLEASGGIRIDGGVGPTSSAVLEGSERALSRVTVTQTATGLKVVRRCIGGCRNDGDVTLRVTAPSLTNIRLAQGVEARIVVDNPAALAVDAMQGVQLTLVGRCGALNINGRMGADIEAKGLECREATVNGAMGADISVFASERASVEATMGASVDVHGGASQLASKASMGGSVERR